MPSSTRTGDGNGNTCGWLGMLAALRKWKAVSAVFGRGPPEPALTDHTQNEEEQQERCVRQADWLQISSRCPGSIARIAEPRRLWNRSWKRDGADLIWDGFCAVCKRPLSVTVADASSSAKRSRRSEMETGPYAYVITLWGSSPEYVVGAMVLAWSLRRTRTPHDLVVVHTSDVTSSALELLQRAGWRPHQVEHLNASARLSTEGCEEMRFAKVFTKLRVLELVQYSKILLMDIDMLVRENIDDVFAMRAPAAMVRGPEVGYRHGAPVDGSYFFAGHREDYYSWGQSSGINAGTMLLHPDKEVFDQMVTEISDDNHPEHVRGNGPEQDYLSRYYASEWSHMSVGYNFQLHHMYFSLCPANTATADRKDYILNPELIKVTHYSSEPKPWARVLEEKFMAYSDEEWLQEIQLSFSGYRAWVLKDKEQMIREGQRCGLAMGPDGELHRIDWAKECNATWNADGQDDKDSSTATGGEQSPSNGSTETGSGSCPNSEEPGVTHPATSAASKSSDDTLYSEDGRPLGEVLLVSQEAIACAQTTLQLTQTEWFAAFNELSQSLGEPDLASLVKQATTGPIIRQEWDWATGQAVQASNKEESKGAGKEDRSNPQYATNWTRSDTGGWWIEEPLPGRYVASCSILPEAQACLMIGTSVLLKGSSTGVYVAAVSPGGSIDPAPQHFAAEQSGCDAARAWVGAVPDGTMVLLAVIDPTGSSAGDILKALAAGGLGCPDSMPSGCPVAAAVGLKSQKKWYTTHAAAQVALASCPPILGSSAS